MKRDFLTINDLSRSEVLSLFDETAGLKAKRGKENSTLLARRTIGMLFDKPSTRTRVSFEAGVYELGGSVVFLHRSETQLSRNEPISHAARVLSSYVHALVIRTYDQAELEEMAKYASIPIINALTDMYHPCQILSDMFTVWEKKGNLQDLKVAWIGDGNNMAQSWIKAAALMGFELALAVPEGYDPSSEILEQARAASEKPITITRDPIEAIAGAEVINTDVWASMGQENEAEVRVEAFRKFQINSKLLAQAGPEAIVLHCLPAHLGEEITAEVLEGPQSVAFEQAGNKLHAQKALLKFLIQGTQC
ncbi:MAG: ornithine carbamoyltransferase [Deltaproteobacteria bacterium]|nr:ornithine carbamoyltransferase [Deltaproteobacteria bacterium]MBW2051154.1 ornithine carbamoyltransferase [Deltaproteobacteria bacterium]MBW2139948.1 ornithine carbamoyltransferase [Deltaproteobacteria bacterium]MBW2323821.1 ornithine carbamoyltransferase [Deltaproteobacteria bacterium]